MIEEYIIKEIIAGNHEAVTKLQHWCVLTKRDFVAKRILRAINEYLGEGLRDYVVRYIFSACPKCGSTKSEVRNHSLMFGDGDLYCSICGKFIRFYDSG